MNNYDKSNYRIIINVWPSLGSPVWTQHLTNDFQTHTSNEKCPPCPCFWCWNWQLKRIVEGLLHPNASGFNLTMPDKNLMCALFCDKLSCCWDHRRRQHCQMTMASLTGYTTDGVGLYARSEGCRSQISSAKMTLFGKAALHRNFKCMYRWCARNFRIHVRTIFRTRRKTVADLNERTNCKVRLFDFEKLDISKEKSRKRNFDKRNSL